MRNTILVVVASLLVGLTAQAAQTVQAEVVGVKRNVLRLRYPQSLTGWTDGEGVCLYRGKSPVACGYIVSSDEAGFEVQLTRGSNKFRPREKITARPTPKFTKSGGAGKHQADLSLGATIYGPKAAYALYFLKFQYVISKDITLGLQPFFSNSDNGNLKILGGFGLWNYFFDKAALDGLYAGLGLGAYSIKASVLGIEESALSIAVKGHIGFHWNFSDSFNLEIEAGGQYLSKTQGKQLIFGLETFSPFLSIDFGWMF